MSLDFPAAFEALTGHEPFCWQRRLYERFAAGDIPDACDIPTGLGKTLVMAIWLAALDLRGDVPAETRLPRRLVYVVDRRAVVDQATEEAVRLAKALGKGKGADLAVNELRDRLLLKDGRELPVSTLRGQFADNRAWLDDLSMPAIVVGTVDMIGSRLLFSGYNVSRGMRPVHAALLGNDALIVLDEAHLVPPFQALVEQVRKSADADREGATFKAPAMRLLTLSATGRGATGKTFTLQPEDKANDEVVRQRLDAPKRLKVEEPVAAGELVKTLAERAWERGEDGRRVIVFCNSNKVARDVFALLVDKLKARLKALGDKTSKPRDFINLIVGARRVREREMLAKSLIFRRFAHKLSEEENSAAIGAPAFLVATSAGEVGVDLDADHMVSDLVPWERMVQRLGRVNRLGDFTQGSLIDVFPCPSGKDKEAEIPAEAPDIKRWSEPFRSPEWPAGEDERRDASPGTLRRLRDIPAFKALADDATTPPPLRPALTRPLVDAFSMNSLEVHPGRPEVAPWIRGWVEEQPQTQILWRRHLPVRDEDSVDSARRILSEFFREAPPHLGETLETESWKAAELLRARAKAALKRLATSQPAELGESDTEIAARAILDRNLVVAAALGKDRKVERIWRLYQLEGADAKRLTTEIAGRTVVLQAGLGGLDGGGLVNPKAGAEPSTLDDDEPPKSIAEESHETSLWSAERLESIGFRVKREQHDVKPVGSWRAGFQRMIVASDEEAGLPDGPEWRVESWVGTRPGQSEPAQAKAEQLVDLHHEQACCKAREIGVRLALPDDLVALLSRAAGLHDLGKIRRNWQRYAGNPLFARDPAGHPPLAKFVKGGHPNMLKIGPHTYRHEFGSLRDISRNDLSDLGEDARELVLHLIGAHHGNARPVIAPVDETDLDEQSPAQARDAALRFARLQQRYGAWGLAWLEALLRAADVAASRQLNEAPENAAEADAAPEPAESR